MKLHLVDTAGQERFQATTKSYFRKMDAILFVYDITDYDSFDNLTFWLQAVLEGAPETCYKMILGNKVDLFDRRAVSTEDASYYAASLGLEVVEVSAKSPENVDGAFEMVARQLLATKKDMERQTRLGLPVENQNIRLRSKHQRRKAPKTQRCCN